MGREQRARVGVGEGREDRDRHRTGREGEYLRFSGLPPPPPPLPAIYVFSITY